MDLATRGLVHLLHYWIPSRREPVPFKTLSGHTPTTELGAPEITTSCHKNKVYQYKQKQGSRYLQEILDRWCGALQNPLLENRCCFYYVHHHAFIRLEQFPKSLFCF